MYVKKTYSSIHPSVKCKNWYKLTVGKNPAKGTVSDPFLNSINIIKIQYSYIVIYIFPDLEENGHDLRL